VRTLALTICAVAALGGAVSAGGAGGAEPERTVNGWLVFSSFDATEVESPAVLVRSAPDGSFRKTILRGGVEITSGVFSGARWSPDGTKIAVTFTDGNRYTGYTSNVFLVNPDGTGMHRLLTGPPADRFSPSWSPDGTKVAYVEDREVHVVDADGSGDRRLTVGFDPAWSPDGSRIAFARSMAGDDTDLFLIGADGSGLTHVTRGPDWDRAPGWSPAGDLLAFQSGRSGRDSIYVVKPDGSGLRRLTRGYGVAPAWSPDGRKIAFGRNGDVWLMNPDGSAARNVTRTRSAAKAETYPAWQRVRVVNGRITGTRFADYLAGGPEPNTISGAAGNDLVAGGGGRDVLSGGPGSDTFLARDRAADAIDGGPGRDTAYVDRRLDRVRGVERNVRG
jgi:TolB protein